MAISNITSSPISSPAVPGGFRAYQVARYDSRVGGHSYADWTSGTTYAVVPEEGKDPIFLGSRSFEGRLSLDEGERCFDRANPKPPEEAWEAISWERLPRFIRARVWALTGFPLITEGEKEAIREEASFFLATYGEGEREFYTPAQWVFVTALGGNLPPLAFLNPVRVACDPNGKNSGDFSPKFSRGVGGFWSPDREAAPLGTAVEFHHGGYGYARVAWRPGEKEAASSAAKAAEEAKKAQERAYGRECRLAADFYGVPYPVALAIGPEYLEEFCRLVRQISISPKGRYYSNRDESYAPVTPYVLDVGVVGELFCGIHRRKRAIKALLPDMGSDLYGRIDRAGQKNSRRVAEYIATLHPRTETSSLQELSR